MAAASTHSDAPTNEKAEVQQSPEVPHEKPKKGLFSKSKKANAEEHELTEKSGNAALEPAKPAVKDVPPASFLSLFRCVRPVVCPCTAPFMQSTGSRPSSNCFWMPSVSSAPLQVVPLRCVYPSVRRKGKQVDDASPSLS